MSDASAPIFADVYCSQCGLSFGPGDHGFSHCHQHKGYARELNEIIDRLKTEAGRLQAIAEDISPRWSTPEDIETEILLSIGVLTMVRHLVRDLGGRK